MNFQEQLSRNARDPREIEAEKQAVHRQEEMAEARRMAELISGELESKMLKAVKNGAYTKDYNKGTVTAHYTIPQNRYLDVNSQSEYEYKTHRCIRTYYQFQPKSEYSLEYQQLRDYLNEWGRGKGIKVSWVVKVEYEDYKRSLDPLYSDLEFPSRSRIIFEGHIWPRFTLQITAVSHFAIDPNFSIDYKSPEDIREKLTGEMEWSRAWLPVLQERMERNKGIYSIFGIISVIVAATLAGILIATGVYRATDSLPSVLFLAAMTLIPWMISRSRRRDYLQDKEKEEELLKKLEEQERVLSGSVADPEILIEYVDPKPVFEDQRIQHDNIEQLQKDTRRAKWSFEGNLEVTLFFIALCAALLTVQSISEDVATLWGGIFLLIIAGLCAAMTVYSAKKYWRMKKELVAVRKDGSGDATVTVELIK